MTVNINGIALKLIGIASFDVIITNWINPFIIIEYIGCINGKTKTINVSGNTSNETISINNTFTKGLNRLIVGLILITIGNVTNVASSEILKPWVNVVFLLIKGEYNIMKKAIIKLKINPKSYA